MAVVLLLLPSPSGAKRRKDEGVCVPQSSAGCTIYCRYLSGDGSWSVGGAMKYLVWQGGEGHSEEGERRKRG
ncbi:hypothetical protein EV126DRAFT_432108 [Verticillium dahliae]|nr:hypothetical protein EV126DRAFT_432108 [Verticillium dahliae]